MLDLGCGNGRFLIGSAVWRADHDHVGIDILPAVLRYATRRGNQRGLANLRFAAIDAQRFLKEYVPAGSVRELHIYHPQPFHDPRDDSSRARSASKEFLARAAGSQEKITVSPRETARRLLEPGFLALAHQALDAEGTLWLQTDNAPYWQYIKEVVPAFFEFSEQPGPWLDSPRGRTRREILALRRGLPVFRGSGKPRPLSADELARLVHELPRPIFDAGPRNRQLDDDDAATG